MCASRALLSSAPPTFNIFLRLCCHLYIPHNLRATMLSRLHEAHQAIARSQTRAHLTIYWSGIDGDIENFLKGCRHCQDHLPSNAKEPLMQKGEPDRPFQQIAVNFASYGGRQFLIVVDCKTGWPDIIVIDMGRTQQLKSLLTS